MENTAGTEFLASINNILQEAQERGFNSNVHFHKVTGRILKFLQECSKTTGARARATCPICLPDGSHVRAHMALPPQGLNLNRPTKKRLREVDTAKEFSGILLSVIHEQQHAKRSQLSEPPTIRRNMRASAAARSLISNKKTAQKRSPESTPDWSPVKSGRRARKARKARHVSAGEGHENEVDCVLEGQTDDKTQELGDSLPTELQTQPSQLGTIFEEHPNTDKSFQDNQDPLAPPKPNVESLGATLAEPRQLPMELPTDRKASPEYEPHVDTSSYDGDGSSQVSDPGFSMGIGSPQDPAQENQDKREAEQAFSVREIMDMTRTPCSRAGLTKYRTKKRNRRKLKQSHQRRRLVLQICCLISETR